MELIRSTAQIDQMAENRIIGKPNIVNSEINFLGKNNIMVCSNNINIQNTVINFRADNSIVFLYSDVKTSFKIDVYNNSTIYLGKDVKVGAFIKVDVMENQNVIIGDGCIIEDRVNITSAESYPIYDGEEKKRLNHSGSVYIGDHVWLGHLSFISSGVKIGSGSVIGNNTFVETNTKIPSNALVKGNPARVVNDNIFFTDDFVGPYTVEDTVNSNYYKSDVFLYEVVNKETLDLGKIEEILNDLDVESRHEFVEKLFVKNKRKNRFSI